MPAELTKFKEIPYSTHFLLEVSLVYDNTFHTKRDGWTVQNDARIEPVVSSHTKDASTNFNLLSRPHFFQKCQWQTFLQTFCTS